MQLSPAVALAAASAAISLAVAGYAWQRPAPGAKAVAAFSAATGLWAGASAVQTAATTLDAKLLADQVQYVGIAVIPVAWVSFAAAYSGRDHWVTRRTVAALSVVPAVAVLLVATNDAHGLVLADATLDTVDGRVVLDREYGAAFWILTAYTNAVNSVGTVMLVETALRVGRRYRRQAGVVLAGATVPWLFTVASLAGVSPIAPEASFGVASLAFAYAISRYGLVELAPVARDRLFEELDDGVLVVDDDRRVADYNPAAKRLLGTDLATGDDLDDAVPARVLEALDSDHDDDDGGPVSIRDGSGQRWVAVDSTTATDDVRGAVVLLRDVTELERRRTELHRENARLERVADTISHDLRNPLTVASGALELAAETNDPQDFERARDALDRMDDIIESTLRVARTGRSDPEITTVSLADVAERGWQNVPTGDADLDVRDDETLPADPEQLESLLENLFRNSVEHGTSDEGPVTVTVTPTGDGFAIADDGVGLPADEREAVFDRGFTTDEDGTGLGLAIVRDIADAHGWRVTLGESDDGGLRVSVTDVATADDEDGERAVAAERAESETARGTD
ncbi:sensor histidine kinase [Halobacterium rubrum]|uniref:sensor histidine kinase n=1 Tax=Halobacterium TaxID=2239 RepID=UPI001F44DFCD|nr:MULTISPECIES: histidine kinase N-terminal 7TM domain-containing protein [Halobacterium]MDH5018719.1 histidine kinase N-terminal 7TM domain-containing protein [Halobacterium rubrum]